MYIKELTASCGLAYFSCAIYNENIAEDVAEQIGPMPGMKPAAVSCDGCRSERGCIDLPLKFGILYTYAIQLI